MAIVLRHQGIALPQRVARRRKPRKDWPLWLQVAVLYGTLAVIVGGVIGLCFLIAWLATGSAT